MKVFSKNWLNHALSIVAYFTIAIVCIVWLIFIVFGWVNGREEYHTPIPFVFGGFIAFFLGLWPLGQFLSGWKKHVIRATLFTACLAPLPIGPEGSLMPAGFGFFYPPLFIMFPQGILLVFIATICFSLGAASIGLWCKNSSDENLT